MERISGRRVFWQGFVCCLGGFMVAGGVAFGQQPQDRSAAPRPQTPLATASPWSVPWGIVQAQQTIPPIEVEAPRVTPGGTGPGSPFPGTGTGSGSSANPGAYGDRGQYIPWDSNVINSDSQRVGTYNQPAWTTQRPFPSTRVFVQPEGTYEVEQWVRPTWGKKGKVDTRFLEEVTFGLPGRWQLDLYERWDVDPNENGKLRARHEGVQIEARWALADWDVIPMNPTIYLEWIQRGHDGESDKYEFKLLLGDSFFEDQLFYGCNFSIEKELGGEKEVELQFAQALGTTIIERKLMGGIEMYYQNNSIQGMRGTPANTFVIGPSLQWRPTNRTFVDLVGLVGVTGGHQSATVQGQMFLVFGYQFGKRAGPTDQIYAPSVARSN